MIDDGGLRLCCPVGLLRLVRMEGITPIATGVEPSRRATERPLENSQSPSRSGGLQQRITASIAHFRQHRVKPALFGDI